MIYHTDTLYFRLPMPIKPAIAPAMVSKHHTLTAMGGRYKGKPADDVQVYDIKTKKWTVQDTMPLKLYCHSAFVMKINR